MVIGGYLMVIDGHLVVIDGHLLIESIDKRDINSTSLTNYN